MVSGSRTIRDIPSLIKEIKERMRPQDSLTYSNAFMKDDGKEEETGIISKGEYSWSSSFVDSMVPAECRAVWMRQLC